MSDVEEWVPWYRRKEYKGNLTEEEKRYLDSFRLEEKHPAAAVENLPGEVQAYLSELELAVYDARQDGIASSAFLFTGIGVLLLYLTYCEIVWLPLLGGYIAGGVMIILAWINYSREWKKNAAGLWIKDDGKGVPFSRTEEKLQEYWELEAINRYRKRQKAEVGKDSTQI